jgi:hypothetical protein
MMKKEKGYGGIVDGIVDNILENHNISKELIKKITDIVDGVTKNVEVQDIGDETFVTIHLNKINFRFKK